MSEEKHYKISESALIAMIVSSKSGNYNPYDIVNAFLSDKQPLNEVEIARGKVEDIFWLLFNGLIELDFDHKYKGKSFILKAEIL
jgi:hypothetical protein